MAIPLKDKLPPGFTLADGMRIVVTALDATTGATVSGVTISQVSIDVDQPTASTATDGVAVVDAAFTYQGSA